MGLTPETRGSEWSRQESGILRIVSRNLSVPDAVDTVSHTVTVRCYRAREEARSKAGTVTYSKSVSLHSGEKLSGRFGAESLLRLSPRIVTKPGGVKTEIYVDIQRTTRDDCSDITRIQYTYSTIKHTTALVLVTGWWELVRFLHRSTSATSRHPKPDASPRQMQLEISSMVTRGGPNPRQKPHACITRNRD